ncbi:MAG: hypothetical protein ACI8RZ_002902 [Myxococcota bacterium]|jgi:hypothetical protein
MLPLLLACSNATAPADDTWRPDTGPLDTDTNDSGTDDSGTNTGGTMYLVMLNEVLADNQKGATNELGDHEDWIELFNAGSDAVDLTGWSLSDDDGEPWSIDTPLTLDAGQLLLIWCDDEDDEDLTELHADFKLSRDGESLLLRDHTGEPVDAVDFPKLAEDQSWGRLPDGGPEWTYLDEPTPGANNL